MPLNSEYGSLPASPAAPRLGIRVQAPDDKTVTTFHIPHSPEREKKDSRSQQTLTFSPRGVGGGERKKG